MALRSKLLDEKVVNLAKEMLRKVRNNAYVSNANSGLEENRKEVEIG